MKKQILTLLTIATLGFANNDIQAVTKHKKSNNSTNISYEDRLYALWIVVFLKELAEIETDKAIKVLRDDCKYENTNLKEYKQELKRTLQEHASEFTAQEIKQLKRVVKNL